MDRFKSKAWLAVGVIFIAGALITNAVWVHYYNLIDARHVEQVNSLVSGYNSRTDRIEASHKRQMGEMRNRVEKKVDAIINRLDGLPPGMVIEEIKKIKEEGQ